MVFRPLPVLTAFTLVSLIILVMLGNWQYERYSDKLGREDEPAWPSQTLTFELIGDPETPLQQVYGIVDGEAVWRRFAPAIRTDDGSTVLLAVDAVGGVNPVPAIIGAYGTIEKEVRIFERVGRSSPRNSPETNTWFVFDRSGLMAQFGLSGEDVLVGEPVELVISHSEDFSRSRTTVNPYGAPQPIDPLPPQRHFGYALTWWGLAAALFVIYWVFHASRGRLKFRT